MFDRLSASIVKEFLMFWRDPKSRGLLIGMPMMQVLIFGFAATMDVKNVDLAIINQDAGRWSQELIQRASSAQFVGSTRYFDNMEEFGQAIERREVLLGLHFPADYSRKIISDNSGEVQVVIDGRRANSGQVAFSYLSAIAAEMDLDIKRAQGGFISPPVAAVRYWFNSNLEFRWFILPGVVATMSMMIALMMASLSIARERELGTFDQLLVSPSSPVEILVSKTIPPLVGSGFVGCLIIAIAVFGFGVPFQGSLPVLIAAMFPFVFSMVGVGLVISSVSNTQQQAVLGLFFAMMPTMLLSGFFTPVENMPLLLQYVAEASPLKHYLIIVQGSFLKSMPLADVLDNVWPMLLIGAVTFSTAVLFVQRRLQ